MRGIHRSLLFNAIVKNRHSLIDCKINIELFVINTKYIHKVALRTIVNALKPSI